MGEPIEIIRRGAYGEQLSRDGQNKLASGAGVVTVGSGISIKVLVSEIL